VKSTLNKTKKLSLDEMEIKEKATTSTNSKKKKSTETEPVVLSSAAATFQATKKPTITTTTTSSSATASETGTRNKRGRSEEATPVVDLSLDDESDAETVQINDSQPPKRRSTSPLKQPRLSASRNANLHHSPGPFSKSSGTSSKTESMDFFDTHKKENAVNVNSSSIASRKSPKNKKVPISEFQLSVLEGPHKNAIFPIEFLKENEENCVINLGREEDGNHIVFSGDPTVSSK
jgi:hypothetical protein